MLGGSQQPVAPAPGLQHPLLDSVAPAHTCDHTHRHTHKYLIKNKINLKIHFKEDFLIFTSGFF